MSDSINSHEGPSTVIAGLALLRSWDLNPLDTVAHRRPPSVVSGQVDSHYDGVNVNQPNRRRLTRALHNAPHVAFYPMHQACRAKFCAPSSSFGGRALVRVETVSSLVIFFFSFALFLGNPSFWLRLPISTWTGRRITRGLVHRLAACSSEARRSRICHRQSTALM